MDAKATLIKRYTQQVQIIKQLQEENKQLKIQLYQPSIHNKLIGISGKIGAGKDTLAQAIMRYSTFEIHKFASKLKLIAQILTGVSDQYTQEGKNIYLPMWGMTVGEFQQCLGTEAIRNGLGKDAWILALFADYTPQSRWIITDVRFPNEAQSILDHGGLLVRIAGTRITDSKRNLNHISETALDDWVDWHYCFDNSANTMEDLERHAANIVRMIGE
jgi:hypothetical protein